MAEKIGVAFEIGAVFPPESRVARWATICAMALNDLLLVNRWLVPDYRRKCLRRATKTFT